MTTKEATPRRRRYNERHFTSGVDRRPGKFVYAMLVTLLVASSYPLYWSFVVGASDSTALTSDWPPLLPGSRSGTTCPRSSTRCRSGSRSQLHHRVLGDHVLGRHVLDPGRFLVREAPLQGPRRVDGVRGRHHAVPFQLGIIPLFILMKTFGWTGSLGAIIIPGLVTAFGVFFMRQYLVDVIPDELIEAARVDGASMIRIFWNIAIPAARPAMAILGLFTFMTAWTDFLWPLLIAPQNPTLQVALSQLQSAKYVDYSIVLAGAVLATIAAHHPVRRRRPPAHLGHHGRGHQGLMRTPVAGVPLIAGSGAGVATSGRRA